MTWTTDKQTTGSRSRTARRRPTKLGSVDSAVFSTSHSVNISGLSTETTYHFRITAEDQFGNDDRDNRRDVHDSERRVVGFRVG